MAKSDRLKGKKTLQVSGFLDEFEKDDIKKDVDIVSLFQHFGVQLTKKGKSYLGLCPWHDDTNPSLSVDKAKGLYNCFGCGESGDIFSLTEKMKGVGFRDALTYLKNFAGKDDTSDKNTPSLKTAAPRPQKKQEDRDTAENTDTVANTNIRRGAEPGGAETKTGTPPVEIKPSAVNELKPAEIPETTAKKPSQPSGESPEKKLSPPPKFRSHTAALAAGGTTESKKKLPPGVVPRIDTLTNIANLYHSKLYDTPKALEYLSSRGLTDPALYARFTIGYAGGALPGIISESEREELLEIGLLKKRPGGSRIVPGSTRNAIAEENGDLVEHFLNCITIPIMDDSGITVGFYGRSIKENAKISHLYLKGKHKGIFNRKASKVYDEIILTESIIDALSLIQLGIENTQSIYGTNGFTDEHLHILKNDRVKKVILALDADEAGEAASERLKETLLAEGFSVQVIAPPPSVTDVTSPPIKGGEEKVGGFKDWNEYLVAGGTAEGVKELIKTSTVYAPEAGPGLTVIKNELGYIFTTDEITYRVTGVKEMFVTSLRVNIKAQENSTGEVHYDNADLYAARSRGSYARALAGEFGIEQKVIERDLIKILEYFERERDRKLREGRPSHEEYKLTEEEKRLGMELLTSPDLFDEVVRDMETLGYTGEDRNKILIYIVAHSYQSDNPFSVIVTSQSASGKSALIETVEEMMPPESVLSVSSFSDKALHYAKDLNRKFLTISEMVHKEEIEYQLRDIQSKHRLSRLLTIKDIRTGEMETKQVETEAFTAIAMTTTETAINQENASRCFIIQVDESTDQTARVLRAQKRKFTLEGCDAKEYDAPTVITRHRAAGRLLKPYAVIIPYVDDLRFPVRFMRARRDHDRFLYLIAGVCHIRQYRKEVKEYRGIRYIEADDRDYEIAYDQLVNNNLLRNLTEFPRGARDLYASLRKLAAKTAKRKNIAPHEVGMTQRDIREFTGFGQMWVKRHLRVLVDYEYVLIFRGGGPRTKGHYRLIADMPIDRIDTASLTTPDELREILNRKREYEN